MTAAIRKAKPRLEIDHIVGWVGKTRPASEVAARMADEFPDGVWLFELAAVADPAAVPDAVAAVLGITQQPGMSVSESVAAALKGRVRLLVFDNCEHVLDAAGDLIEAVLAHSATVTILTTSRQGLGVVDEQLWQVPSLDVGAGIDSAAVSLFVERAQPGGLVIKDLDSVNGVYVDGAQIEDKTQLSTGAVIRIGPTTAIFEET